MQPDEPRQFDAAARLRSGLLYLVAWLFVAAAEYRLLVDSGDVRQLFSNPLDRPFPILLLAASIVLLALAFRDLSSWLRGQASPNSNDG